MARLQFEIVQGETEHIHWSGARTRKSTILLRVGKRSISRKAFILGAALVLCQVLDGLLTYIGLRMMGISMEGNSFLRVLMEAYGLFPALFLVKTGAVGLAVGLTFEAHRRKWVRPIIASLVTIYIAVAVIPWTVIVGQNHREAIQVVIDH